MAVLTAASVCAGVILLVAGEWNLALTGLVVGLGCTALTPVLEWLVVQMDDSAVLMLARRGRAFAWPIAIVSGTLPILVILAWELAVFLYLPPARGDTSQLVQWLWAYGVATGPWTMLALRVSRFRRTLCGIRAYAGHVAFWLLSGAVMLAGWSLEAAAALMLLPAILPLATGYLLALADRDALTNVRI